MHKKDDNISKIIGLSVAGLIVLVIALFFVSESKKYEGHERITAAIDVSELPQIVHGHDLKPSEAPYIWLNGIKYEYVYEVKGENLTLGKILGYEVIEGYIYNYYASFSGLSEEEWILRMNEKAAVQGSLSGGSVEIYKAAGVIDIPAWLEKIRIREEKGW